MKHFIVIIGNRSLGYIFNLFVIPYCVLHGKNEFVRFYIISLIAKTFFDSATIFYPLVQKFNSVTISKTLSIVLHYRLLVSFVLFAASLFMSVDIFLSLLFMISCILNMEFHFNLENDSKNLFIQSNVVRIIISFLLLLNDFSDTTLILVYVFLSLLVSIYGYSICRSLISWKPDKSYFTEFKKMFYLTAPAVLNYGSRESGIYLMYNHLGRDFVFSDRVQKSVLSITAALGPFSAAFPDKFLLLFKKFKYGFLILLPVIMALFFFIYVSYANEFRYSTFIFSISLFLGSINYLLQLFYFNLKGRFREVYILNLIYASIGLILIFCVNYYSSYYQFPYIMLVQELFLFLGMLLLMNKKFSSEVSSQNVNN